MNPAPVKLESTTFERLGSTLVDNGRNGLRIVGGWLVLTIVVVISGLTGFGVQITSILCLLGSIGLFVAYYFLVHEPQRRIADALHRLCDVSQAEQKVLLGVLRKVRLGDLVIDDRRLDGVAPELTDGIARATGALGDQIERIQERSQQVAVVGGEVQKTASELASGFSQQGAAVVEITATIEELARTATQISQNAEHQADLAEMAETEGNKGAAAVKAAVGGLHGLGERIAGIAQRADSLGSRSNEIYRILDLINEIAHDTHILSLNAAIEAETAGDHGRRFAVVAEEVRRLAHRARESVQSVRAHLEEFSGAIRSTVVATEEGTKEARQVMEQAHAAQNAIEQLRQALSATSSAAQEISFATREQRTASNQVATTIKEVREVIQRMADGLRNFTSTAKNLNDVALAIQLVTQAFRFDSPRSLKHAFQEHAGALANRQDGWEGVEKELENLLKESGFLEFCYLVDAEGTLLAAVVSPQHSQGHGQGHGQGPSRGGNLPNMVEIGKNYSERPWFKTVQQTGSPTITPLYESLLTSEQCFTVVAPILTDDGRQIGVLGADVNLTSWIEI